MLKRRIFICPFDVFLNGGDEKPIASINSNNNNISDVIVLENKS